MEEEPTQRWLQSLPLFLKTTELLYKSLPMWEYANALLIPTDITRSSEIVRVQSRPHLSKELRLQYHRDRDLQHIVAEAMPSYVAGNVMNKLSKEPGCQIFTAIRDHLASPAQSRHLPLILRDAPLDGWASLLNDFKVPFANRSVPNLHLHVFALFPDGSSPFHHSMIKALPINKILTDNSCTILGPVIVFIVKQGRFEQHGIDYPVNINASFVDQHDIISHMMTLIRSDFQDRYYPLGRTKS